MYKTVKFKIKTHTRYFIICKVITSNLILELTQTIFIIKFNIQPTDKLYQL